jgi:ABC-type transport system substrate-binding protein
VDGHEHRASKAPELNGQAGYPAYAIGVDSMLVGAYEGTSIRSYGMVCPCLIGNRQPSSIDFNPEKAKVLLSEAGVTELSLVLKTLNHAERVLATQIIQANLADVRISLEVIPLDSGPAPKAVLVTIVQPKEGPIVVV